MQRIEYRLALAALADFPQGPAPDGLKVIECRRSSRGNERLEFWREFSDAALHGAMPALAALALSRASSEIV